MNLLLFLHAHLPFVRHPEHPDFLEEEWLFEALTETYLPLLALMEGWQRDGLSARITWSLSPSLLEMWRDPLLMRRYQNRIEGLRRLAALPVAPELEPAAQFMRQRLKDVATYFEAIGADLVAVFRRLAAAGIVELCTTAATHGFLPLLPPSLARAQVRTGLRTFRRHLGQHAPGFWLPECAYRPGLDLFLAEAGAAYFVVDAHGVVLADPAPVLGTQAPIVCPSGVLAFPRDPECSRQVWSATEGYPGDPRYREFYRDRGWDATDSELALVLPPGAPRRNLGLKYHRITDRGISLALKAPYDPLAAQAAAEEHAEHFVRSRTTRGSDDSIIVAPYDAELFGHWWFEGPVFLDRVVRKVIASPELALSTPGEVIKSGRSFQRATPARSTWGDQGYAEVWLNPQNDWIWPQLDRATRALERALAQGQRPTAAARELLLASGSDWPFMLTMQTTVQYAQERLRRHLDQFWRLLGDPSLESEALPFPDLDLDDFRFHSGSMS